MLKTNQIKRKTNLELLRILAMLMIVTLHFLGHGGVLDSQNISVVRDIIIWWIEGIAYASVNIYVLISGYFMIKSNFKISKLIEIVVEVWFYSVIIYVLMLLSGKITFELGEAIQALFPIFRSSYWFISTYVVIYCLSPFLNFGLRNMSKKMMQRLLICLILFFCIWDKGSGSMWFICLYVIAAYLRLHYVSGSVSRKVLVTLYTIVTLSLPISRYCIKFFTLSILGNEYNTTYFYRNDSIILLFASVLLFLIVLDIHIKNSVINNIILLISPLTLAVYLIHDNNNLRKVLWDFINPVAYIQTPYFIIYMFGIIICIFSVCILIEYFRQLIFKRIHLIFYIDNISKKIVDFTKYKMENNKNIDKE